MDKVSIIMTTFNCAENLEKTLQGILMQDYPLIEVVIADGGSTDGTLEVIKEYKDLSTIDIKWKSEKDNGIYDAMNKGFKISTGDIILFLNDVLAQKNSLSLCVNKMKAEKTDGCHSDLVYLQEGKVIRYWKMGTGKIEQGWMPAHPTLLLKREVYEKFGLYKTNYKVAADYEFMVRILYKGKVKISYIPEITVNMFYGGTSTQGVESYFISLTEAHQALKDNKVFMPFLIDVKRIIKVTFQFMKTKSL